MMRGGRLFAMFSTAIGAADGVLVKTMGDGCLASFGSAADAVTAAVDVAASVLPPSHPHRAGARAPGRTGRRRRDRGGRRCVRAGGRDRRPTVQCRRRAPGPGHRHGAGSDGRPGWPCVRGGRRAGPEGLSRPGVDLQDQVRARASRTSLRCRLRWRRPRRNGWSAGAPSSTGWAPRSRRRVRASDGPCSSGVNRAWARPASWRRSPVGPTSKVRWSCSVDARRTCPWRTNPSQRPCERGWSALDPAVVAAHVAVHGGEIRRLVPVVDAAEPTRAEPALEQASAVRRGDGPVRTAPLRTGWSC